MTTKIPKLQALATLAFVILGVAIFVYLMGRFGGPELGAGDSYEVSATFADSEGISAKSDVLVRGVKIGEVSDKDTHGSVTTVTFRIFDRYAPLRRGATVRIGEKTLLAEAYVDVDLGRPDAPELASGERIPGRNVRASVELDEALEPFVRTGGAGMRSLLRTFGRGARSEETSTRVNLTFAELSRLVSQIRDLTVTLRGQEHNIAAGVHDTRIVLSELGEREAQVRSIVTGGRATLEAVAAQRPALEEALAELPLLLDAGRETLAASEPLLREARPVLRDLRAASPELTPALRRLRPVTRDAGDVIDALAPFNRVAVPFLERARPVVSAARPVARDLGPALRNLVPMTEYLEPRKRTFISWFSNTNAIRSDNPDGVGEWVRFLLFIEDKTAFGTECKPPACQDFLNNAYAREDDAPRLEAHQPGTYPRLRPFTPR